MIRTIKVELNAAFPNMPLLPFHVFHGSAAAITVLNVPRRIVSLSVKIKNVSAVDRVFPAQRSGSAWVTVIPGSFFEQSGKSTRGVKIDGADDAGNIYTLGAADLVVMLDNGSVEPVSPTPSVLGKLPLRALPPYLHYLSFDDTYPADAAWLYAQLGPSDLGRCSAVRRGGKLFRNYDWTFDDAAEFVVRMSGDATRFASVGVASVGSRLTENDVMSAVNSRYYKCLPGMTLDGINEKGVVCEINVDGGPKTGWHGDADDEGIHILAAVRWVLDNGLTAAGAAAWLASHVIKPEGEMNFHFMVADATATYIVENGEAHDVTDGTKVLTNYALYDDAHAGGGKERYTLLAGGEDISAVNFTNAYKSGNTWDSDFESAAQHAEAIRQWAEHGTDKESHRGKTSASGKAWWQSVHTTEYNFAAKTMKVAVQEVDDWYTFAVDQANVDLTPIVAQLAALQSGKLDKSSVVPSSPSAASGTAAEAKTARNIADTDAYGGETDNYDWTWSGGDDGGALAARLNVAHTKLVWDEQYDAGFLLMDAPPGVELETWAIIPASRDTLGFYELDFIEPGQPTVHGISATRTSATKLVPTGKLLSADNPLPASGSLAKFGVDGKMLKADPSGTSQDPANADYRDPIDNTCHKTEFGEWVTESVTSGYFIKGHPIYYFEQDLGYRWMVTVALESDPMGSSDYILDEPEDTTVLSVQGVFTVTRPVFCTDGKKFVTEDVAAKKSEIFGSDGKPTDQFAADLMGKQVANAKVRYALATTASAAMADRTVNLYEMNGNGTITFPTATTHEGVTYARDFLLRVKVTTAGSLTLPTDVTPLGDSFDFTKANDWLIAFTEIGKDANNKAEFYIRAISLEG